MSGLVAEHHFWGSEVSASIPALSAAICVSSVSLGFRPYSGFSALTLGFRPSCVNLIVSFIRPQHLIDACLERVQLLSQHRMSRERVPPDTLIHS